MPAYELSINKLIARNLEPPAGTTAMHIMTIASNGYITTQGTINSTGDLTAPNIYTQTEVDNLLTQTHPLLLTTSELAVNNILCRYIEPPTGVIPLISMLVQ